MEYLSDVVNRSGIKEAIQATIGPELEMTSSPLEQFRQRPQSTIHKFERIADIANYMMYASFIIGPTVAAVYKAVEAFLK